MKKVDMQELGLGNNGLVATEDIKVDELIGFFPTETFLSQTLVMESDLVKQIPEMPVNTVYVKKAVFLMEERRKPDSPWLDYIQSMPNDWSSFPLFYSNEDYEMLRGSHAFYSM